MVKDVADIVVDLAVKADLTDNFRFKDFNDIHKSLCFFAKSHYNQYVPTLGSEHIDFEKRLANWLQNDVSEQERALLLELAPQIVFLAREDITKLHESAVRGPIYRWIIDSQGIKLEDHSFDNDLNDQLEKHTWFTSITDSMQISEFHHINQLGGTDYRPDWKSLAQFGDPQKIKAYMLNEDLKRIVILEDFVGSGTQMKMGKGSVEYAAANFPDYKILLCPLIICPKGAKRSRDLCNKYSNLSFDPVIELTQDQLLSESHRYPDKSFKKKLLKLCKDTYEEVIGDKSAAPRPYSYLGFHETGAVIVMYTNTPANTLPLIQHQSNKWNALFPRSARIK